MGIIIKDTINASISGNAATATKATQDGSGRTITTTYSTTGHTHGYSSSGHTHGTITLSGDVTGSASIGSGTTAINITTTVANNSHSHTSSNISNSISASSGITSGATGLVQGKAVQGYAATKGHTHGTLTLSGDVTGSATIASGGTTITTTVADDSHNHTKLGTATKGSATQPIYLSSGTPTACTYTLGKSVPSDAKFTDTDTKVTSVDNHYAPSANTGSTLSAAGGTLTDIANSSSGVQVVTGLKRDAKGHVVGVNSVALKSTNTTYSAATTGAAGLMSAADKTKLDGIATGANKYTLPNAGTASKPIYITGNTPTQCTSIDNTLISKSAGTSTLKWSEEVTLAIIAGQAIKAKLPANPDTNSDTKVTQTTTTSNANYPLLLAPSGQTATTTTTSYFKTNVTLNPSTNILSGAKVYESLLQWGNTNISGGLSPMDTAMDGQWSANRLSFQPVTNKTTPSKSGVIVEYSTNGGTTWTDYGLTDAEKTSLITTGLSADIRPGKLTTGQVITSGSKGSQVRVTISAFDFYFSLKKIYIYLSVNGASNMQVKIEASKCGSDTTYTTVGTYKVDGWSGWNSIPCARSFGGGETQTSNTRRIRMTFFISAISSGYESKTGASINKIAMVGETMWGNSGGNLPLTGHLYNWDASKNAIFPTNVYANTFVGSLSGTATNATNVNIANIATSSTNSSYPLLFTSNVTAGNKRIYTDSANDLSYNPSTNELSTNGDIRFKAGNTNKYITFDSNDGLKNSWRIGYLGSGSGDGNYLTFESTQSTGTFVNALQISNVNLTSTFSGDVLPSANNSKSLGSSSLKWANVYATTFNGNATSATKATNDGSGRTITTTYSTTGHTHSTATTSAAGFMSAADKAKLDGIATGANKYTLPTATATAIGGIKVAAMRLSAIKTTQGGSAGTYYGIEVDSNGKAFVNVPPVTTASTTTYGTVKLQSGELSGVTSHADTIAASYYHSHGQYAPKQHASTGTTYGLGSTGGTHGHVKLISGDLNGKTAKNGEAAAAGHTHSQYALQSDMQSNEKVIASALNDLDTRLLNINRNAITNKDGITPSATDLVEGKAVYEYASPKSHATSLATYGLATTVQYGHVKISNGDVSTVATSNGLAAGMDHYHSKTRISTTTTNAYMPMLFVNATASGDTKIYIDSSTGTGQTSSGIRYNPSGNTCYCSGGFFEASDERLKNFGDNIEVDLDKLAQLPKKYFTWKHDEDGKVHIGTSAQELQKIYPELVDTLEDGTLIVSYDTLSVIALKGVDTLYEKYKSLEERLNKLEKMLE